ncbi:MAG: UbiA family prenyltransferase [Paracoccaceae bacterium]
MTDVPTKDDVPAVPLVLDVDGTLLRTDLLYETFWAALRNTFLATLRILLTFWTRPAQLKHELHGLAALRLDLLPVRAEILDMAEAARSQGREVRLASGSDRKMVEALARQLNLPGVHFGSDPDCNLTGAAKAARLVETFGEGGFDYAGNARADLPCWEKARRVIVVSPNPVLSRQLGALEKPVEVVPDGTGWRDVLHELRPHQWVKNLLLFLPMLAAHLFEFDRFLVVLVAAIAFSLGASSLYVVNDMLDLEADRMHPAKHLRPIASGRFPIHLAMIFSLGLAIAALGLSLLVGMSVFLITAAYLAGGLLYSLALKKSRWVDLVALTFLYLMRVVAGAAAAQIPLSPWLAGVVVAVVLALAMVKRITGLSRWHVLGHLPGRGYDGHDIPMLLRLAYVSSACALGLFLGYAFSPDAAALYSASSWLALGAIPMGLWLIRIIRLSRQGVEDYDPVVFITHDIPGLALVGTFLGLAFLAA